MNFSILVRSEPVNPSAKTALLFANAIIQESSENHIDQIFFYSSGVQHANKYINIPIDEINLIQHWQKLSLNYGIPLYICSTSANYYGIVKNQNLNTSFTISGLGQLSSAILTSDRVIEF